MKEFKLPREFAEKWVKALQSGRYQQGRSYLYSYAYNGSIGIDKFCCLGVACIINGIDKNELRGEYIKDDFNVPDLLKGSRLKNPFIKILTDMNDGTIGKSQADAVSFVEIADWIEENVEFI